MALDPLNSSNMEQLALKGLMVNMFYSETCYKQAGNGLETGKGPFILPKFHELWSTNG